MQCLEACSKNIKFSKLGISTVLWMFLDSNVCELMQPRAAWNLMIFSKAKGFVCACVRVNLGDNSSYPAEHLNCVTEGFAHV